MQSTDHNDCRRREWSAGAALATISLLSSFQIATAQESSDSIEGEEQCIFDQDEQHAKYLELERQYSGSRYVEEEYALRIPQNGDLVTLKRGGCVHFGVSIEFRTPKTTKFEDKAVFFAKVLDLVTEFDQALIDRTKLEESIRDENWLESNLGGDIYYSLTYPDVSAFEIFRKHDKQHTTIGVSFYY